MQNELERLKASEISLRKKLQDDAAQHQREVNNKAQELKNLKSALDAQKVRISELEKPNLTKKVSFKRPSTANPSISPKPFLSRNQSPLTISSAKQSTANSAIRVSSSVSMSSTSLARKHEWMEREVSKYVEQKEAVQMMEKEIINRSQMIKRRSELEETKKTLYNATSDDVRASNLALLQEGLDELNKQIEKKQIEYLRTSQVPFVCLIY